MQILCRFCLLIFACSFLEVSKRFLAFFLGLLIMDCASFLKSLTESNSDFGCGFLVFGCFPQVFNFLGLFLMFYFGLKFLQFGFHGRGLVQSLCSCIRGESSDIRSNGVCSKFGFGEECDDAKIVSCSCGGGPLKILENSKLLKIESKDSDNDDKRDDDNERECCEEDQEFDVMVLRGLVKIERQRANSALMELEKERMAAASAANEAMGMILRLQSEKSAIEIEANHYRRMAEQKQDYDREVIQSLQWIVMKHESERSQLEEKLKSCKQKLKHVNDDDDEIEQFEEFDSRFRIDDGLVGSLDMDSITEW